VLRVAADRTHDQREAATLRIEQPAQAIVLRTVLDRGRQPALDVPDLHQPYRTERATRTSVRA
jgi:hypothetical protein